MNISRLNWEVFSTREKTSQLCIEKNLLPSSLQCELCFQPCFFEDVDGYIAGRFRCQKKDLDHCYKDRNKKKSLQSAAKNTFIQNSKLGLQKSILLTYCWSHDYTYKQIRNESHSINDIEEERLSQETLSDWNNYLREVSVIALDTLYVHQGKIGGPGRQRQDYIHETVNHSLYYKNPITGVHTNHIESNWRPFIKSSAGHSKKKPCRSSLRVPLAKRNSP